MMRTRFVDCLGRGGFHRMAYHQWGPAEAPRTVLCVHGLTRNGRDFDALATVLSRGARIVCPDVVGRGLSDWLADSTQYVIPNYLADMTTLLARIDAPSVDWVGTSMGGLIGMSMAAMPGTPIRRLVLNDIGPFVPKAALQDIAGYVGQAPRFPDLDSAAEYLALIHAGFGPLARDQWRALATTSMRPDNGFLTLHYDPGIARPFADPGAIVDIDLWALWDAIDCPVLVLRGAQSNLLLSDTAAEMSRRGTKATVVEVDACGHAPSLMEPEQIQIVTEFLRG